jgi:hypothetical protein
MSLWRKRQIVDLQLNDVEIEDETIQRIKQDAKRIHADMFERKAKAERSAFIHLVVFDLVLLCTGALLCAVQFGIPASLGLVVLALYVKTPGSYS